MLTHELRPSKGRRPRASRTWVAVEAQRELDASGPHPLEMTPVRAIERNSDFDALSARDNFFSQEFIDAFQAEVAILGPDGNVAMASKSWRARSQMTVRSNGLDKEAVCGRPLDFLSSDDETARLIATKISRILSGKLQEATLNFAVRQGSLHRRYRLQAAGLGKGKLRGAVVVNEDVTETYELNRDKRLLTEQLVHSEDNERRRIAREMHDSTLQDLVAIGLNLKRLRHLDNDEVAQDVLAEVRSILSRTQQDVRTLSYLLHPPLLDEGGLPLALSALIRGLSTRMSMKIDFVCDCCADNVRLPMEVEVALYRVAQEGLINIHKHASATHAWVHCSREADQLVLTIEDDGIGICGPQSSHFGSGVGIQGMRARLQQLEGKLTVSSLRQGTRLKAFVPLDVAGLA